MSSRPIRTSARAAAQKRNKEEVEKDDVNEAEKVLGSPKKAKTKAAKKTTAAAAADKKLAAASAAATKKVEKPTIKKQTSSKTVIETTPLERAIYDHDENSYMTILSWNVAGLRALLKNKEKVKIFTDLISKHDPDVFCLQEHKLQTKDVDDIQSQTNTLFPNYQSYWTCSTVKKGYSGVVVFVKGGVPEEDGKENKKKNAKQTSLSSFIKKDNKKKDEVEVGRPSSISGFKMVSQSIPHMEGASDEGRIMIIEFDCFRALFTYVPNSGQALERLDYRTKEWDVAVRELLLASNQDKPIVWVGDLNVAHRDIDIYNFDAKHIPKTSGCTKQERDSFTSLLESGFVDGFRYLYPEANGHYSYWSTRAGNRPFNRGLRLDYAICSNDLKTDETNKQNMSLHDVFHPNGDTVSVSDHAPVVVVLKKKKTV